MKRALLVCAVILAVAGLSACKGPNPPDAAPAQAAMDAAKAAGVDSAKYADMKTAQDKMAAAQAEITRQKGRMGMMQDFKAAEAMLGEAKASAEKALAAKKADDEAAAKKAAEEAAKKKPMKKKKK